MSEFWWGFIVGFFWFIVSFVLSAMAFGVYVVWNVAKTKEKYLRQTLSDTDMKK